MLSWAEYIEELLNIPTVLDNLFLQHDEDVITVSPIVKASIQMLESMVETEGRYNVFVFPEIEELLYELVISKIVFNVSAGKINIEYDPRDFKQGQKLKYKNCVVEFDRYVKDSDGFKRFYIRLADGLIHGIPSDIAPIFQLADSNTKRFSKSKAFNKVYSAKKARKELASSPERKSIIEALIDYKTHLDGSIFLVTNIRNAKDFFDQTLINGTALKDVLLIGKIQTDGSVESYYSGQLSGNPAIVLAPDLYSVQKAIKKGAEVQSIIINSSQGSIIENQLNILDELSMEEFPVLCLTDTRNSFDLEVLLDRDYNVWRWDSNSLVKEILASDLKIAGRRIQNCAKQNLVYERVNCKSISEAHDLLYAHKSEIENQRTDTISSYNKLFSLLFTALRIAVPFDCNELYRTQSTLKECRAILDSEKRFINQDLYKDLMRVIDNFENVFKTAFVNPKASKISEIIASKKYSSVCIVIADKLDKVRCEAYWRDYAAMNYCRTAVKVLYPQEYVNYDTLKYDATIIVGWLNKKNMRDVIYCYGTMDYIVLTYLCEEKWRNVHTRAWNEMLSSSNNRRIIKNSFSKTAGSKIADDRFVDKSADIQEDLIDELSDIESLIQRNTYRQYGISTNSKNQVIDAYPVNFVGGYFAFYRVSHEVITVTDVIVDGKNDILLKTPDSLKIGDFVAIREAQKDIIQDIADRILANKGKAQARDIALRWRNVLRVETMFHTLDEIYHNLQLHGCERKEQTIKNWIEDEKQFSVSNKEDLFCIAKAFNDNVLLESIDEVFASGVDVHNAHKEAGRYLSQKLRAQVAERITGYGDVDAFNIWEPIELQLEDIGKVTILKIIDINRPIKIDSGNTNRLLSE